MYCKKCGKLLDDQTKFCPECGQKTNELESPSIEKDFSNSHPVDCNEPNNIGPKPKYLAACNTCGILSIVCTVLNFLGIYYIHLVGIILGIITLALIKTDRQESGTFSQSGKVTGTIGVCMGVFAVFYGIISNL